MAPADILAPRHAFHLDSINPSPDIKYKLIIETVSGMDSQTWGEMEAAHEAFMCSFNNYINNRA